MKKFNILFPIWLFITALVSAQECTCETNFAWVKKTFEENDAGFQYAIDTKGMPAYVAHNALFAEKVSTLENFNDCADALYSWLTFFRDGHIGINRLNFEDPAPSQTFKPETKETWETLKVAIPKFEKYLNSKKEIDFEGIWETPPYKVGIKKVDTGYVGFITETTVENWKTGQVKFKFTGDEGVFYLRDKSAETFAGVKALGKNYLQLGRFTLKRVSPQYETEPKIATYFESISAENPFGKEISPTTFLLRIPSFDGSQKKVIDSVITANKETLLKTENLIIDLRNNGGGSDWSYQELLPFIYTNPVRIVGLEFLSTKLNNQRMIDLIENPDYGLDEESKKWAKTSYDTLEKHLGTFVNLDTTKVSIEKLDTIYPYPKQVGILINKGNGSTTEQFLLAAKQSKKVKLFGATTYGVLDISNMNYVPSPCGEFQLGYCLSKSYRIPEMAIDGKGIQPDYYLDDTIEPYNWIPFVEDILKGN